MLCSGDLQRAGLLDLHREERSPDRHTELRLLKHRRRGPPEPTALGAFQTRASVRQIN
jgi:hypothetical protein